MKDQHCKCTSAPHIYVVINATILRTRRRAIIPILQDSAPWLLSIQGLLISATSQLSCWQQQILCYFPNALYQTFAKPVSSVQTFSSDHPRSGSHLPCILQNRTRMSPQTLPRLLLRLHLNLMSVVLAIALQRICLCSRASRVLLTSDCTLSSVYNLAFRRCTGNLGLDCFYISYRKYRLDLEKEVLLPIILHLIRETQNIYKQ